MWSRARGSSTRLNPFQPPQTRHPEVLALFARASKDAAEASPQVCLWQGRSSMLRGSLRSRLRMTSQGFAKHCTSIPHPDWAIILEPPYRPQPVILRCSRSSREPRRMGRGLAASVPVAGPEQHPSRLASLAPHRMTSQVALGVRPGVLQVAGFSPNRR
jgi:hypothetical protein